ncbi:MAG: ABC transporter permease, partial [Alphaproteobacteria bacterium]|nr:ABC transporter permease [Alphaproteobacteria bacterium]
MTLPSTVSIGDRLGGVAAAERDRRSLLKKQLRRSHRLSRLKALGLVMPLLLFILVTFVGPIAEMLFRSIENPLLANYWPRTVAALRQWDGRTVPDEAVFAALHDDLVTSSAAGVLGQIGTRLNYDDAGLRSLINKTEPAIGRLSPPYRASLSEIDPRWVEPKLWQIVRRAGERYTIAYYLAALDLRYEADGSIGLQPEWKRVYLTLFFRTFWVALSITALCLLLGYPIAYLLASLPQRKSRWLMFLVLLPFWTSLLVRTTAWMVLLQPGGVVNDLLVASGIIEDDHRLSLIYNMTGTFVAMTHILLPFMVLPIYSVMKTISSSYIRAANSLGANPVRAFWLVYAPQTMPGVRAGSILVFILAVGYYITPALVG